MIPFGLVIANAAVADALCSSDRVRLGLRSQTSQGQEVNRVAASQPSGSRQNTQAFHQSKGWDRNVRSGSKAKHCAGIRSPQVEHFKPLFGSVLGLS